MRPRKADNFSRLLPEIGGIFVGSAFRRASQSGMRGGVVRIFSAFPG